jgi:hypothetical protein
MKKILSLALPLLFAVFMMTTCDNEIVRNLWPMYEYEYTKVTVHAIRGHENSQTDSVYMPTALYKNGKKIAWWSDPADIHIPDDIGIKTYTIYVCTSFSTAIYREMIFPDMTSRQNSSIEYYTIDELAQFEPDNTSNAYSWHINNPPVSNSAFNECFTTAGTVRFNQEVGSVRVVKLPKRFIMGNS